MQLSWQLIFGLCTILLTQILSLATHHHRMKTDCGHLAFPHPVWGRPSVGSGYEFPPPFVGQTAIIYPLSASHGATLILFIPKASLCSTARNLPTSCPRPGPRAQSGDDQDCHPGPPSQSFSSDSFIRLPSTRANGKRYGPLGPNAIVRCRRRPIQTSCRVRSARHF